MNRRHAVDGGNDWNRRLSPTCHHIDVGAIQVGIAVDRGYRVRANRSGGKVYYPLSMALQHRIMVLVCARRGRIENNTDVGKAWQGNQPVNPTRCDWDAEPFGALLPTERL